MKNTVGHTGIYAWGDCVRHRFFQKLRSNRRTKNPLPLGMGSVNGRPFDDNWGLEDPTGKDDAAFKDVIMQIHQNIIALENRLQTI